MNSLQCVPTFTNLDAKYHNNATKNHNNATTMGLFNIYGQIYFNLIKMRHLGDILRNNLTK